MAFPLNQLAPQNYGPQAMALPGGGTQLTTPRYTQEQTQILNNLAQMGAQNADFGNIENRARSQFATQTIPGLAERFTSMGGGQRSSAFQGALGQAGADLESQLAAQRAGFGLQQLGLGLQPQFESYLQPSPYQGLAQGLTQGFGAALPGLAEVGAKYYLGGKGGGQPQQQQQPVAGTDSAGSTVGNIAAGTAASALPAAAGFFGSGGTLAGLGAGLTAAAPFIAPAAIAAAIPLGIWGLYKLLED